MTSRREHLDQLVNVLSAKSGIPTLEIDHYQPGGNKNTTTIRQRYGRGSLFGPRVPMGELERQLEAMITLIVEMERQGRLKD